MNEKQPEAKDIDRLAEKVLKSPRLLRRLSDRVYELLQEDIRNQRDRARNSSGRMFF